MAAAHLSEARVKALAAATLTLCGYKVSHDSLGGTMTPAAAILVMETELALAEGELQTDHEPFLRVFDTAATAEGMGPWKEMLNTAATGMMARALALVHG
jgi:hypothetical protein